MSEKRGLYGTETTVHLLLLKTYTINDNGECQIAGFPPFGEDICFACTANFTFGRKMFHISKPILWKITPEDLSTILASIPSNLLDTTDGFMFSDEQRRLISKERVVTTMALAMLEQNLRICPPEEKGTNLAFARWMMCETLNVILWNNFQTIYSLIG